MNQYDIASNGVRYNPKLKPSEDVWRQVAEHKAKVAKEGTLNQRIRKILESL